MRSATYHEWLEERCVSVGVEALAVVQCTKTRSHAHDGYQKKKTISVIVYKLPAKDTSKTIFGNAKKAFLFLQIEQK